MMFTTEMLHLTAVVLQTRADAVAAELLRLGVLHFVDAKQIDARLADVPDAANAATQRVRAAEIRHRIEGILQMAGAAARVTGGTGGTGRTAGTTGSIERTAGATERTTVGTDGAGETAEVADAAPDGADLDAVQRSLDRLTADLDALRAKQKNLQTQINRFEDVRSALVHYERVGAAAPHGATLQGPGGHRGPDGAGGPGGGTSFVDAHTGTIPVERRVDLERDLSRFPSVIVPLEREGTRELITVVTMKRNAAETADALDRADFQARDLPHVPSGETAAEVERKLDELRAEQASVARSLQTAVVEAAPRLRGQWKAVRSRELLATVRTSFAGTQHAVVFAGWVPAGDRARIDAALQAVTNGHVYCEWHSARELAAAGSPYRPPSRLRNPRFLRPFQNLVTSFGMPAYGTVDPTVLVAIAYLAMFGLMFGDAGQGAVLVLVGLAGLWWSRHRVAGDQSADAGFGGGRVGARSTGDRGGGARRGGSLLDAVLPLSKLIVWCGGAAMAAGVLFGSYFGMPLLPALWFDYHAVVVGHAHTGSVRSIFDVLQLTIYLGVTIIGIGLLLNWINLARERRWFDLVFDKAGVLAGAIYAGGVWAALHFALSGFREVPAGAVVFGLIVLPSVALFLKAPLAGHSRSPAWWVMEWVIELLELFSGYLANTLSFMRVAGLGIAHVMLMVAFFQIAEMVAPHGFNLWAALILVLGNVLVILLEGLSAGIQSLRLNYYEFFSKHFQPSGVRYDPVTLDAE